MRKLTVLANHVAIKYEIEKTAEYGGGEFELPADHVAALVSPKGFSCAVCKWVDAANHACKNPHYIKWNHDDGKLPDVSLQNFCSDWFEP